MMKMLKFYYFSFLYFFKDKPESWVSEYRSLFLVQITTSSIFAFIWLIFDPNLKSLQPNARLIALVLNIVILATLHRYLLYRGKHELIFDEFNDDSINTKGNRMICWVIWVSTFVAPMLLAVIQNGGIK